MLLSLHKTINKLKSFIGASFPILSVYVPIFSKDTQLTVLENFTVLMQNSLDAGKRRIHETDIVTIKAYIHKFQKKPNQKGIIFFSGGNTVFEVINTTFTPPTISMSDYSPYLVPLEQELRLFKRYLVIVADRQKWKFFTIYRDEPEDISMDFRDKTVPQKVKAEGMRKAGKIQSSIQEQLRQHMREAGNEALGYTKNIAPKQISGVILVSHKELFSLLKQSLPSQLRDITVKEVISEIDISVTDLTQKIVNRL